MQGNWAPSLEDEISHTPRLALTSILNVRLYPLSYKQGGDYTVKRGRRETVRMWKCSFVARGRLQRHAKKLSEPVGGRGIRERSTVHIAEVTERWEESTGYEHHNTRYTTHLASSHSMARCHGNLSYFFFWLCVMSKEWNKEHVEAMAGTELWIWGTHTPFTTLIKSETLLLLYLKYATVMLSVYFGFKSHERRQRSHSYRKTEVESVKSPKGNLDQTPDKY